MKTIEELKAEAAELERKVAEKRAADEEAKNPERLALEKRIADAKRELGIDDQRGIIEELMRGYRPAREPWHPWPVQQPFVIGREPWPGYPRPYVGDVLPNPCEVWCHSNLHVQ